MAAFPGAAGASVGTARGVVELDISQLEAAARAARTLGRGFENALGGIDSSAKRSRSSFMSMSDSITSLRGELVALSVGAGILTNFGLTGAKNLRNYTLAFKQFVGTQEEAEKLTARLITQANRYGLEWEGVAQLGRALLPSLKEGAKDLDAWVSRAARLRSLFPTAPRGSETIAISEFLAGQNTSLARRFNVPLSTITEATSKFQDLGQAMDYILERRGATEEAAQGMADSFVGVRNELQLLLAEGFTPLFQMLQPVLASFREWVSTVRQTNPEVATFGAGLIAATAAGAPLLLLLNQLIIAGEKLKALGVLGALGRGGVLAGAAAGGGIAGLGITRAIGRATGDDAMANRTWADIATTAQKLLFNIGFTLTRTTQLLLEAAAYVSNSWHTMIANMLSTTAGFVRGLASLLPGGMGSGMGTAANALEAGAGMQRLRGQNDINSAAAFSERTNQWLRNWARSIVGAGGAGVAGTSAGGMFGTGDGTNPNAAIITQWATNVQSIEREAAAARLKATRDYEEQRTQAVAQYEQGITRDAEDFARSRARAAEQMNRQIADIEADADKRDIKQAADYEERVGELRADANERIAKIEEDYAKSREEAASDHRDRLLSAASRLDAVALREEQKRFAKSEAQATENHDEQVSEAQKALDKRLADERESYEERTAEQRLVDAERIQDLRDNLAESQRLEDEDRLIAQTRRSEDFAAQQAQAAADYQQRLADMATQAAEERKQLDEAFMAELEAAGVHNEQYLALQKAKQDASLALFDSWWDGVNKRLAVQGPQAATQGPQAQTGWLTDFNGGRTQPAGGFPTSFAQMSPSVRSVTVEAGAITVNAAAGQSEEMIARQVREELIALLEGVQ